MQPILEAFLCLIHNNAGAHKCKLVQDILEADTMVQLHNPPYSPALIPCDFFLFTFLKINLTRRRYEPKSALGSAIVQCLQGVQKRISVKREHTNRLKRMKYG